MNKKILLGFATACMLAPVLSSCGGNPTITMWVGAESVEFYKQVAKEYMAAHPDNVYQLEVAGANTGAVGGMMETDNTACADIITIAHDNIGKLSRSKLIVPIAKNSPLIEQIKADNPESFVTVSQNKFGNEKDAEQRFFGVPYISQALFMYYNKKFVSEEQSKTFEGLLEAANTAKINAMTFSGGDGFNFSLSVLAVRESDKRTSTVIYKDFDRYNAFFQGNDTIAVARYFQDVFGDLYGAGWPSKNGWTVDLGGDTPKFLSFIGGAWHYDKAKAVLKENMGVTLIPTFTLKESHVEGLTANELDPVVPKAGDVYRGGTFADCKVFAMNMAAGQDKYNEIEDIMSYFSKIDLQKRSFKEARNVPAFNGADVWLETVKSEIDPSLYDMASSQMKMAKYGIPQPFVTSALNNCYYQKGAPDMYKAIVTNESNAFVSVDSIRTQLYKINYVWTQGKEASTIPPASELPKLTPPRPGK